MIRYILKKFSIHYFANIYKNKAEILTIQELLHQFQRKIDDNENVIEAIALNSKNVTYA